jgi:hypothetical protein
MQLSGRQILKQAYLKAGRTSLRLRLLLAVIAFGLCAATTVFVTSKFIGSLSALLAKLWLDSKLR